MKHNDNESKWQPDFHLRNLTSRDAIIHIKRCNHALQEVQSYTSSGAIIRIKRCNHTHQEAQSKTSRGAIIHTFRQHYRRSYGDKTNIQKQKYKRHWEICGSQKKITLVPNLEYLTQTLNQYCCMGQNHGEIFQQTINIY